MYLQIFFKNVRLQLDQQGLAIREFCRQAGITPPTYWKISNGEGNPTLSTMEAIANALNVPLPSLLDTSHLTPDALASIEGRKPRTSPTPCPPGYERVSAVVTKFQAWQIRKWEDAARSKAGARPS